MCYTEPTHTSHYTYTHVHTMYMYCTCVVHAYYVQCNISGSLEIHMYIFLYKACGGVSLVIPLPSLPTCACMYTVYTLVVSITHFPLSLLLL